MGPKFNYRCTYEREIRHTQRTGPRGGGADRDLKMMAMKIRARWP